MYMYSFVSTEMSSFVLELYLSHQYIMVLLCHHQAYLIILKVFFRLLDMPEFIKYPYACHLISLFGEAITKETLRGYSFTGSSCTYNFVEMKMLDESICVF